MSYETTDDRSQTEAFEQGEKCVNIFFGGVREGEKKYTGQGRIFEVRHKTIISVHDWGI